MSTLNTVTAKELCKILNTSYSRINTLRKKRVIEPMYALGASPYRFDPDAVIQAVREYRGDPVGSLKTELVMSQGRQPSPARKGRKELCLR